MDKLFSDRDTKSNSEFDEYDINKIILNDQASYFNDTR